MHVRIVGRNLPGRTWMGYENVHVGVQRRTDVVDLVAGDAGEAVWDFTVEPSGDADFRGPYVQGRRGERFFYLSWGDLGAEGTFERFRRAKLMLTPVDAQVRAAAAQPGRLLRATLSLTGGDGGPRCAAVRPPAISWTAEPTG